MKNIRSRKHSAANQPLLTQSLIAMAAIGLPAAVQAQAQEKTMAEVQVQAGAEAPYKAEKVSSPKLTQPLVDTPQTVSVIKKEVMMEQGASTIMEALRNTPGITLQLGENGNTSAGDTFQLRGFNAQSALLVDGIRDLGAITRDTFNIEQIEVSKGPAGADIGRGAAGGYINLVSKLPTRDEPLWATASYNSGGTKRATADLNRNLGSSGALRLNAMAQDGGQPGRKVIDNQSHAIAPSIAWGLGTPTRLYLFSQHVRQDNTPDGGIPSVGLEGFYNANSTLRSAPRVDRGTWYGLNGDYEKADADMITAKIEHELAPNTTLTNTTRWGKSKTDRILTGINTLTAVGAPETWTVSRSRQSVLQENRIRANTTNIVSELGAHTLSGGLELLSEEQLSPTRTGLGGAVAPATTLVANLYHPNRNDPLSAYNPQRNGAFTQGKTDTVAAYLFDTWKWNAQWQLNGGVRAEHYSTESNAATLTGSNLISSHLEDSDHLLSFKAGLLYKPAGNGSLYLAWANSKTPPGSANFSLSSAAGNINGPGMTPQKTTNVELGTKWDVLAKKLALTAALYRTENRNEITQLDAATNTWSQLGKRRVQGLELGAVGQITNAWQVIAGLATMDTEIKQGTTGNNAAGAATRWSPKLSATLWTSFAASDRLTIAAGARYLSRQQRVIDPSLDIALQNLPAIPSYAVADAMVSYKVAKHADVQLNVYNLFDRLYINTLNNSGARASLGAPRSAQLSVRLMF